MTDLSDHYKAIVVGAGPIGAALALALARLDSSEKILLIDAAESAPSIDPVTPDARIFAINEGSRSLLESLNVWSEIEYARCQAYDRMHVWDAQGTGNISFDAGEIGAPQLGHIVEANVILNALLAAIERHANIQSLRPEKVAELSETENGIQIRLASGASFSAELICAADGAMSELRSLASIPTTSEEVGQQALVANIYHELPNQNCAWQIFHSTGPLAFLPLADLEDKHMSSIVWSLDTEDADRIMSLADAEFERELYFAIEEKFGALSLGSKRFSFPLVQRHASEYVRPGFALVGDAAHSIHPLAGLGANIGFQDVSALVAQLDRATRRGLSWGEIQVLKRYQRARKLDNQFVLNTMKGFKELFGNTNLGIAALRNLGLNAVGALSPVKKKLMSHAIMRT